MSSLPWHTYRASPDGLPHHTVLGNRSSKKAVVYVHGWGCQSRDFFGVIEALAAKEIQRSELAFLNLALDLPGHGETPLRREDEHPSMVSMASMILDLVTAQGLEAIVLVGHSMGVRIALEAWHQCLSRPALKVSGTVFIDGSHYQLRPSLFAFDKGDPRSAGLSGEEIAAKKAEAFQSMFSAWTPSRFRDSTVAHVQSMDKVFSERLRNAMIEYDEQCVDQRMREFGKQESGGTKLLNLQSSNIGPDNRRVAMNKGDEKDHRWMQYIAETILDAKQVVITDSAHFPHVDRPDAVADEIHSFLLQLGFVE